MGFLRRRRRGRDGAIEEVNLSSIRYTIPTLAYPLPDEYHEIGRQASARRVLEMHEDDWRQVEFVSMTHRELVGAYLADIVSLGTGVGASGEVVGYERCVARDAPELMHPLGPQRVPLDDLTATFSEPLDGVSFRSFSSREETGVARDSYASVGPSGLVLYGLRDGDHAQIIGLHGSAPPETAAEWSVIRRLWERELLLVDWCRGVAYRA